MKRFQGKKGTIILGILVVMLIGYYFYVANYRTNKEEEVPAISALQSVMLRDLEKNYPPSPKEVVKYYSEITKCFYDGAYTEEELDKLAKKSRELFDAQLAAKQTDEEYLTALKYDINRFASNKWTISSYAVSPSVDVEEFTEDGYDFARLYCIYTIRQETRLVSTTEVFLLRKDENGHYKIFGWDLAEQDKDE